MANVPTPDPLSFAASQGRTKTQKQKRAVEDLEEMGVLTPPRPAEPAKPPVPSAPPAAQLFGHRGPGTVLGPREPFQIKIDSPGTERTDPLPKTPKASARAQSLPPPATPWSWAVRPGDNPQAVPANQADENPFAMPPLQTLQDPNTSIARLSYLQRKVETNT